MTKSQTNKNMTTCKSCNKEIAKSVKACPFCGAKRNKPIYKKWFFWAVIVFAAIGAISSQSESNDREENNKNNQEQTEEGNDDQQQTEENTEGGKNNPYSKGSVVTVGDIEWNIISAENIGSKIVSGNMFIDDCVADSGSFVKLVISVKNNRSDMFTLTNLYIYDNQDRQFIPSDNVYMCVEDTLFILDNINPGIQKTYIAIYEIPEDAANLKLELNSTESLFSGETNKYISLGF